MCNFINTYRIRGDITFYFEILDYAQKKNKLYKYIDPISYAGIDKRYDCKIFATVSFMKLQSIYFGLIQKY